MRHLSRSLNSALVDSLELPGREAEGCGGSWCEAHRGSWRGLPSAAQLPLTDRTTCSITAAAAAVPRQNQTKQKSLTEELEEDGIIVVLCSLLRGEGTAREAGRRM